jgi:hypothetical protein
VTGGPATPSTPPPHDVSALRERLRALGYLDARVDRFVLAGAAGRTRSVSLALAASGRIGILAGVLLGPAAAIGITTRVPGLVTNVTDALVLAAYLTVPFGLASATLACLAITSAGWIMQRHTGHPAGAASARRAAITGGLLVAAACLAYLTLWWRAAVPADTWTAPLLALAVAASIAVLIGHVVTVSTLAYLVRLGLTGLPGGTPLSSWRVVLPVGVVALAGAMVLLRTLAPSGGGTLQASPPLVVVPTGMSALVIAIDGVDVPTLTRLRDGGVLPTFDMLLTSTPVPMHVNADRDPAQVWTTLATGQPVERHGIRALEGRQLAGVAGRVGAGSMLTTATDLLRLTRPTIASGDQRRVPTFWEVAASAGLRTAVVHWWATWPAAESLGTVLSDRAILRLEQGGALSAEIAPASVYAPLMAAADDRAARVDAHVAGVAMGLAPDVTGIIERSARLDATVLDLATDPALGEQDLLTVYLPGLDIAQHALLGADRARAVEAYYAFLDEVIAATVLKSSHPGRVTFLVTQPGRVPAANSRPEALVALSGAAAALAGGSGRVAPEALAPTVLRVLGVPVAEDLGSPSAETLLRAEFRRAFPLRSIATYGEHRARQTRTTGRPLDREMIDRMRSLGYLR